MAKMKEYYRNLTHEELDDLVNILDMCADLINQADTSGLFSSRLSRSVSVRRVRGLIRILKNETYPKKAG